MQNKNKTTFLFDYSVRESRLLGFAPTKRLDQLQVPATNEEIKNILNNNEDLSGRLEKLKKLEREKRATIGDSKEKIKLLKKAYEEKHEIPIADTAIEKIVHELIEAHDKEVGTAIQIRSDGWKTKEDDWGGWDEFENEKDTYHDEGEFILVHASSSAAKLVLKHHESAGGQVNQEEISKVFKDAGFEVDSATYKKDEIPTAKPFSKVIPEGWKINVPVKEGNSVPETAKQTKAVPAPSTERLLSDNAENKKLLDKVIGGGEKVANGATNYELKRTMRLRDENGRIKGSVSGDIKIEKTEAGKFAQFGANRVWGKIVGVDEWVALSGKNGRSWNTKEAGSKKSASSVERNFFNDPSETNRRKFSSVEFAKKVNASGLAEPEKTALIEAAIKLDVTVTNRRITESGKNRGVFLEKQAIKNANGKKKVQKLFEENVGTKLDLADFYRNMSEKSSKNKTAIKNILEGDSKVFMLRIDREEHNGNFDSRIEETRGAAWIADLDVPQKLRNAGKNKNPEYIYKYSKIFDPKQKTEILKKYLPGKKFDQANYKIAQVEIPNCENPAIVIKKKPTPVPVAPKIKTVGLSATAVQIFKNVPDGWTRIFRIPDWFTTEQQRNYLADPAILDGRGETVRESEYLNARKRLDPKPHKFLATRIDDILGWWHGSIEAHESNEGELYSGRDVPESLDTYLEKGNNKKFISEIAKNLEYRFKEAGEGNNSESLWKRVRAQSEWQKEWTKKGADERQLQLAKLLYDWDCKDFATLSEEMEREEDAFYLAGLLKNHSDKFDPISPKLETIFTKYKVDKSLDTKAKIESALYDEDKINAARRPLHIGDAIFIPPTFDKKGRPKIVIWENQAMFTKEMLNVHSPLSLMIEVASLLTGYFVYGRTGLGRVDALGEYTKYLEEAEGSEEAKKEFEQILKNQAEFDAFRDFIIKGQVPVTGGNKISLPLNEIQVLIPGWKLLIDAFGWSKSASGRGSTGGGVGPVPRPR